MLYDSAKVSGPSRMIFYWTLQKLKLFRPLTFPCGKVHVCNLHLMRGNLEWSVYLRRESCDCLSMMEKQSM